MLVRSAGTPVRQHTTMTQTARVPAEGSQPVAPLPKPCGVGNFLSPASFWFPEHFCESAWIEHAPFAYWLLEAHRPSTLVDRGTCGFAFLTFCQAVQNLGLDTKCFSVGGWHGNEQPGRCGEDALASVRSHIERRYSSFASFVHATFDALEPSFPDGSVDLVHIGDSGSHESVRHDFERWLPKLSRRGIMLFHDVNGLQGALGVDRSWREVRKNYPYFEFLDGHGLGVLAIGEEFDGRLRALFSAQTDESLSRQIRQAYARLGSGLSERSHYIKQRKALDEQRAETNRRLVTERRLAGEMADRFAARIAELGVELDAMKRSYSWRVTRPLRIAAATAPWLMHPLRKLSK
jgi:hypothetical protein